MVQLHPFTHPPRLAGWLRPPEQGPALVVALRNAW